jgi:hypothetical protein
MEIKIAFDILPAAFTGHHAVVLLIALDRSVMRRGRGRWKMDPTLIQI